MMRRTRTMDTVGTSLTRTIADGGAEADNGRLVR